MPIDITKTHSFRLFLDEALRQHACQTVERFLSNNEPVKKAQLHSIPAVIQARGLSGLRVLIENQKNKNTKKENKAFWGFIADVILTDPGPEYSLRLFLQSQSQVKALLQSDDGVSEKKEQKRIRKSNRAVIEQVMEEILQIYFEHFNCHYFYKTAQGASS